MSWLIGLIVFTLSVTDDILVVFYLRRVSSGHKIQAALFSGLITGLISLEITLYITDMTYILFNVFGSIIGTPLAMWADDRWPAKKLRDKKGRYKALPPIEIIKLKKEGE
ncbi:MAG: hypothetical protein QMD92_00040 [bacterium]|nr:hypothetical protein [bacterium]